MKKVLLLFAIIFFNCDDQGDKYLINYIVNGTWGGQKNLTGMMDVTFTNEDGAPTTITIDQDSFWSITIGPVRKGFVATLSVENVDQSPEWYITGAIKTTLKNGTSYDYKATNSGGNQSLLLVYTVQ